MIFKIIRFDLGQYFRSISTYVYFVLLAAIAFLLIVAAGGAFQGASVSVGGGGKVLVNSPYSLAAFISALSYCGLLIVSAISGKAAFGILKIKPIPSSSRRLSAKRRIWAGDSSPRSSFSCRFSRVSGWGWRWER